MDIADAQFYSSRNVIQKLCDAVFGKGKNSLEDGQYSDELRSFIFSMIIAEWQRQSHDLSDQITFLQNEVSSLREKNDTLAAKNRSLQDNLQTQVNDKIANGIQFNDDLNGILYGLVDRIVEEKIYELGSQITVNIPIDNRRSPGSYASYANGSNW